MLGIPLLQTLGLKCIYSSISHKGIFFLSSSDSEGFFLWRTECTVELQNVTSDVHDTYIKERHVKHAGC